MQPEVQHTWPLEQVESEEKQQPEAGAGPGPGAGVGETGPGGLGPGPGAGPGGALEHEVSEQDLHLQLLRVELLQHWSWEHGSKIEPYA